MVPDVSKQTWRKPQRQKAFALSQGPYAKSNLHNRICSAALRWLFFDSWPKAACKSSSFCRPVSEKNKLTSAGLLKLAVAAAASPLRDLVRLLGVF